MTTSFDRTPVIGSVEGGTISAPLSLSTVPSLNVRIPRGGKSWVTSLFVVVDIVECGGRKLQWPAFGEREREMHLMDAIHAHFNSHWQIGFSLQNMVR